VTEEKQPGDQKKKPAEKREQEETLAEEVSEGKSLAGRIARKLGERADERLEDHRKR
jgi:hypothetical protein